MPDNSNSSTGGGGTQWFLQIHDGNVFGPVPARGLRKWAEQGRIAPGNKLSKDKKEWVVAESLPELKMTWWVERDDGSLQGPFNRKALDALIQDGTIPAEARLIERNQDETPEPLKAENKVEDLARAAKVHKKHGSTERRRIRELENRLQTTLTELEKMRQAARPKINVPEEVLRLRRELEKAQTESTNSTRNAEALTKDKAALQKKHLLLEERIAILEAEPKHDVEASARQCEEFQAALDESQQRIRELEQKNTELESFAETLKSDSEAEIDENEELASVKSERDSLNEQLLEHAIQIETLQGELNALKQEKPASPEELEESQSPEGEEEEQSVISELKTLLKEQQATFDEERRQFEEQMQDIQASLDTSRSAQAQSLQQLEDEKRILAETLEAANSRDTALQQQLSEYEEQINKNEAPFREPGPELTSIIRHQVVRTEDALKTEQIFFETIRDAFIEKQRALREQVRQLQVIGPDTMRYAESDDNPHPAGEEVTRLREHMLHTEQEFRREKERAGNREKELSRKIEQFDAQLTETRQRLSIAENEATELRSVRDELRSKEHQLAMLRSQYEEERAQTKAHENDLNRDLDPAERLRAVNTPSYKGLQTLASETEADGDHFNIRQWMKLR